MRSNVVVSVLVAAAAVAACQSSDGEPGAASGGAGFSTAGRQSLAGAANAAGGNGGAGAARGGDAGASGAAQAPGGEAGEGAAAGSDAQAGRGNAGGATAGSNSGGNAGVSAAAGAGQAGSAGEVEGGAPDGPGPREVAYLGGLFSGLFAISVDPVSGKPTALGDAIAKDRDVAALAVDPQQRFVYVAAEQGRLDVYRIAPDGTLPPQPSSTVAIEGMFNSLALDPLGRFAYGGSAFSSAIYGYKVDRDSGVLTAIGDPLTVGDGQHGGGNTLAIDPTGHFMYVSNAFGFGIIGYEIDSTTGALGMIAGSPFGATGIPGDHNVFGGALAIKPSGDYLYSVGGALNAFAIAADGTLSLVNGSPFTLDVESDADATNLSIDPQGRYLYATNAFLTRHIHGFQIDPGSGSLTPVPGSPFAANTPYSIAVDPSGRLLYVGVDDENSLDAYTIRRSDGSLTRIDGAPYPIGGLEPALTFTMLPAP